MKTPTFEKTAAKTAKTNNVYKHDNKNVIDYNFLVDHIAHLPECDLPYSTKQAIACMVQTQITDFINIKNFLSNSMISINFRSGQYLIYITATIHHYCVYDKASGKQLYKYHFTDNCVISIYDSIRYNSMPIYHNMENEKSYKQFSSYIEINI